MLVWVLELWLVARVLSRESGQVQVVEVLVYVLEPPQALEGVVVLEAREVARVQ